MVCGVRPHVIAMLINAAIHVCIFFVYGTPVNQLWRFILSFFFFIYPCSFVTDILWSLRPSIRSILSGETLINRKYYMNIARREIESSRLLPVTISIPVYTEENEVIFGTIRQSLAAAPGYREYSGREVNILISDDGLAPLLGGKVTREEIDRLTELYHKYPSKLSKKEFQAIQRIIFYRENNVGFIARPAKGRAGLFKKASNLNYTLRFIEQSVSDDPDISVKEGYYEGDIRTNDIILLLDKDSGVKPGTLEAIVPEFAIDDKLSYVQCATDTVNLHTNYYSRATGQLINELFHFTWPCKALQGFFVPLVGHNAFIRKSHLDKCGRWNENKVSEDFDLAIRLYSMGYHGKYAKIPGLEFTEYTSENFSEEAGKQRRYAYGLFEMMFDGTVKLGKTRSCDLLFMITYFFSIINQVMLLPTVFMECYFGNIHLLWAGFLLCDACFILLPWLRSLIMRRKIPKEQRASILCTVRIAVSSISNSLSIFSGVASWFFNKFRRKKRSFPSTKVGENDKGLIAGIKLILGYIKGTWIYIPVVALCVDRSLYVMTRRGIGTESRIAYCFIFFSIVLAPIVYTPPLFSIRKKEKAVSGRSKDQKNSRRWIMEPSVPEVVDTALRDSLEDDVAAFLKGYEKDLADEIAAGDFPDEITVNYTVEGCLKKDDDGKKETYLLKRRLDGIPAILRITKDYKAEDALEEAGILKKLDHAGIPKVYAAFEKNNVHYLIREYFEGRSLDSIIRTKGTLPESDIYRVTLELTGILKYLHSQKPPVIHRDIKPQNIVLGKDGSINLIDFGIAREHKSGRRHDTSIVLTLDYAPPEQYGFDQSSPLTDIYALGVVMLFMATGQASKPELGFEIVSNELRNLIQRCVAFDPRDRISNVEEIEKYIKRVTGKKKSTYIKTACFVAAMALLISGAYIGGRILGEKTGKDQGFDQGYDEGFVQGYKDVPVFMLGEKSTNPGNGNLPSNILSPGGAYAASYEGGIFFIKDGDIYKMKSDGSDVTLFYRSGKATGLCVYDGWLYFSSDEDITQVNIYDPADHNITYGGIDGQLVVLDSSYYIRTDKEVYSFDLSDWSLTPVGKDFIEKSADPGIDPEISDLISGFDPLQLSYESRGIVMIDPDDSLIWMIDPEGNIRNRVTKNRALDFNISEEWIFYHNADDQGNLWCVRFDGADDHRI